MSRSTGPILAAGTFTWANQTILSDKPAENLFENSVRIGVSTALLAGAMYGIEKVAPPIAIPLSWAALVTVLLVRINGKPTPLERVLALAT